jgi:hypothetical protein
MPSRRFILLRIEDASGNSGTGAVADGCLFPNGRVALTWRKEPFAMTWYDDVSGLNIHRHEGRTLVRWLDHTESDLLQTRTVELAEGKKA